MDVLHLPGSRRRTRKYPFPQVPPEQEHPLPGGTPLHEEGGQGRDILSIGGKRIGRTYNNFVGVEPLAERATEKREEEKGKGEG